MQKIPTLFLRDPADRSRVLPEVNPQCEWVLAGEGTPTLKHDGTCVMLDADGSWWARREVKPGKPTPDRFMPVNVDDVTGKVMGWEPIEQSAYAKYHAEALANSGHDRPGTYELVGPKVNGNPDGYEAHLLMPHGWAPLSVREEFAAAPRDFEGLRTWLLARPYEGIVWHHPDGRMAKLKARDFGAAR